MVVRLAGDGREDDQVAGADQLLGAVVHPDAGSGTRLLVVDASHLDVSAAQSRPVRVGRNLRGIAVDDQQDHLDGHPSTRAGRAGAGPLRPGRRGAGARTAVHRGRDLASLLVMGRHPRLYSGKHKTTGMNVQGRVHPRQRTRLDLRSDRGSPPRRILPGRVRRPADARFPRLDRRQRLRRLRHDHPSRRSTEVNCSTGRKPSTAPSTASVQSSSVSSPT